jgi:thiol:disulfide interchange protein
MTVAVLLLLAGFQFDLPGEKHVAFTITAEAADPFDAGNTPSGKVTVRRGETFFVTIKGEPQDGWYTYPVTKHAKGQSEGQLAKFSLTGDHLVPLWPIRESEPEWKDTGVGWHLQHKKPFTWVQEVFVKPDAPSGKTLTLTYQIDLQVCKNSCIQEPQTLTLEVPVSTEPALNPPVDVSKRPTKAPEPEVVTPPSTVGGKKEMEGPKAQPPAGKKPRSWLGAILFALAGGFGSLATPCVFPMIPITVSYFIKQGEAKKGSPVVMALVYSGTIALVLIAGGLALMALLTWLISQSITNFVLAALFIYFALSLLGWYDITLPSWLQDMTASGENQGGLLGVFFMALTFSIISFACVGPIYGGFIGAGAGNTDTPYAVKVGSVVAFSCAFASPFFLLALFPVLLRRMPRAGSWMNAVKVVMGFLELAAAIKFIRSGEILAMQGTTSVFTYAFCMALYVALCVACGLYLLGLYRLPHDHEAPENISVPRLGFALCFLSLSLYLVPGIFPMKDEDVPPKGVVFSWVDSFLLPESGPKGGGAGKDGAAEQPWLSDLEKALAQARAEKKLVFLDITGVNCTNCKKNERFIFPRADVKQAFRKHVLLHLYADASPPSLQQSPDVAGTIELRKRVFSEDSLPLYALLRPKEGGGFDVVARYGTDGNGLIESGDVPAFLAFLASE